MQFRRPALAVTIAAGLAVPLAVAQSTAAAPAPDVRAIARLASLCAPPADTVAPVVTKVTFGRASISVDSAHRTQSVTVTATDTSGKGDPSGVKQIGLEVAGKRFWTSVRLKRTSGTAASGKWTGHFVVSKYAHAGTYRIEELGLVDAAGNSQFYVGSSDVAYGPNSLSLLPADNPTFTVTGTPATPPSRNPAGKLSAFSFSPATIDTTHAAHYVHVSARFSGPAPTRVFVEFVTERKPSVRYVYLHANLHDVKGVWTGSVRVPRWLGEQTVQPALQAQWSTHYSPMYRYYDPTQLDDLHFPIKLGIVSGIDKSKPVLKGLTFSPSSVDSTAGAQTVNVTARARDIGSGVSFIDVDGSIRNGANGAAAGVYPFYKEGIGYLSSSYFHARLRKGSDGRWHGTTTIRRCVPSGTYKLNVQLSDYAGNYKGYSTAALKKAGLTSTIQITSKHGDVVQPYVYSAATYGADSQVFLNFSEGVKNVNTSTLTVFPLSPAKTRFQKTSAVTGIVCANGKTKVDCSDSSAMVTSAILTIPSLKPGAQYAVFANLNQVTTQLTDGNGNPMDWNYSATQVKDS